MTGRIQILLVNPQLTQKVGDNRLSCYCVEVYILGDARITIEIQHGIRTEVS
jgi:hypothetical protein